jgi:quercetin dioxygenase-like cupin family protein
MTEQVVHDPVLKQRLSFSRTTDEDGGEVLLVDSWVDPGGGVTPHVHPAMEETFKVLAGRAEFLAGRKWKAAGPGETVVVPAGTRHAYRNRGSETAHIVCEARPPSSLQEFLEEAAALSRAGRIATRFALPKGLGALLEASAMIYRHREMVQILFPPLPPPSIQRFVIPLLARLGERRGYSARSAHGAVGEVDRFPFLPIRRRANRVRPEVNG